MWKAGSLERTRRIGVRALDGDPGVMSLLALVAATFGSACSSNRDFAPHGLAAGARSTPAVSSARAEDAGAATDPDRVVLGSSDRSELDFEVLPVPGERSALLVAQSAGDPVAAVRRIDGKTGSVGPLLLLRGESVYGALDGADDRFTLVTSASGRVCLSTYRDESATPDARGCAVAAPVTVALVGDRVALIEARQEVPPEDPAAAQKRPAPKHDKPKKTKRTHPRDNKKGAKHDTKPKKHTASAAPQAPQPKPKVDVLLRWATREGSFDADATPIGLRFERPYEGMNVVAAAAKQGGIDLLWYEFAGHKRKGATPAGDARLMLGSIGPSGALDPASTKIVAEGPLELGAIAGHRRPRLLANDAASLVVDLDDDKHCTAHRITSSSSPLTPSATLCAIDPARLLGADPPTSAETSSYERIFDDGARRVNGQPRHDPGLVAWAGDRAYYVREAATHTFRSAARSDALPRDEPAPFVASRSRIAWGALEPDGEGVALAAGKLCSVSAAGAVTRVDLPEDAGAQVMASDDPHADRRHIARIGASWWLARGDVMRILPKPLAPASLAHRAHPDTSALVGGRERGLFLELEGPRLRATPIADSGPVAGNGNEASMIASPVRVGFDAASRAGGGAIVAGVAATPSAPGAATSPVVAFTIDAAGHAGPVRATSLPMRAGALAVRVVALPDGGAILSDRERTRAVWLDDEGREIGAAPWPDEESDAACLDGGPARVMMPTPEPGRFIRVAELAAAGTCIVGDPVWTRDGSLRWLGSRVHDLDSTAEVRTARVAFARIAAASSPVLPVAPPASDDLPRALAVPTPSCPAEMVSIAQQFCVDRFESELVDDASGERLSPDFTASPGLVEIALGEWVTGRELVGDLHARSTPLPLIAPWQRGQKLATRAVSRLGVRPSGYVSGLVAADACRAAGKRLCSHVEFITACRGEADEDFPYGDDFDPAACNVFRDDHPAALLHGNASLGHLDPRLNRVVAKDGPMLRETGASLACRSRWGSDAVYDMVGNLDEWVDDPSGFAGGFYSRSTRSGCDAMVTTHPAQYLDYSLGVRCCKDANATKP